MQECSCNVTRCSQHQQQWTRLFSPLKALTRRFPEDSTSSSKTPFPATSLRPLFSLGLAQKPVDIASPPTKPTPPSTPGSRCEVLNGAPSREAVVRIKQTYIPPYKPIEPPKPPMICEGKGLGSMSTRAKTPQITATPAEAAMAKRRLPENGLKEGRILGMEKRTWKHTHTHKGLGIK